MDDLSACFTILEVENKELYIYKTPMAIRQFFLT